MEAKDLKTVTQIIMDGATWRIKKLSDDDAKKFDAEASKIIKEESKDLILAKFSKFINMNILDMNVHFFDNLPRVWLCIQNAAEPEPRIVTE